MGARRTTAVLVRVCAPAVFAVGATITNHFSIYKDKYRDNLLEVEKQEKIRS